MGASFPVKSRVAVRGKPLRDQCIGKYPDMLSSVLGHAVGMAAQLLKKVIYGVLPVKEFPQIDAGRVEAKTSEAKSGIGVEEHRPVVKFLTEYDQGIS